MIALYGTLQGRKFVAVTLLNMEVIENAPRVYIRRVYMNVNFIARISVYNFRCRGIRPVLRDIVYRSIVIDL